MRVTGIVKWYNEAKGFGFIGTLDGADVFVHYNAIQPNGYRTLNEGAVVEFEIVQGKKGPQAEQVKVITEAPTVAGGGTQSGTKKG